MQTREVATSAVAKTSGGPKRRPVLADEVRKPEAPADRPQSDAPKPWSWNKGRKFPPEVLDRSDVDRLLEAARNPEYDPVVGQRNCALLVVMWRTGLRLSEALNLELRDLDLDGRRILVRHGKGDKRRVVGLDRGAVEEVEAWLSMRATRVGDESTHVFCTLAHGPGRRMSSATWQSTIKRIAERAGIERRVHSHGLRHTFAAELVREGVHSHVIQRQLGHTSLVQTEHYLSHLEPKEVVEAMQRRRWDAQTAVTPGDNLELVHALERLKADTLLRGVREGKNTLGDDEHARKANGLIEQFVRERSGPDA